MPKRNGITWRSNFRFSFLCTAGSTSTWVCSRLNSSTCVCSGLKLSFSEPTSGVGAFSGSIVSAFARGTTRRMKTFCRLTFAHESKSPYEKGVALRKGIVWLKRHCQNFSGGEVFVTQ